MAMDRRGYHDEETRMKFWAARLQIVMAPLNIRALYSDAVVDDDYRAAIADLAWHALRREPH